MKQLTQDNKLKIIEQIIILNDDDVFERIERIINESIHRPKPTKLSKKDLLNRAQLANKDIHEKDIFTQDSVETLTQNW